MSEEQYSAQLSPRERELLTELAQIKQGCQELCEAVLRSQQEIRTRDQELAASRRLTIELKEENAHLREVLQTGRERMDSVLSQLRTLK